MRGEPLFGPASGHGGGSVARVGPGPFSAMAADPCRSEMRGSDQGELPDRLMQRETVVTHDRIDQIREPVRLSRRVGAGLRDDVVEDYGAVGVTGSVPVFFSGSGCAPVACAIAAEQ